MVDISRETFEKYDIDNKLNTIFDLQVAAEKRHKEDYKGFDSRLKKTEKRKLLNTAFSAIAGGVGGFIAIIAKPFMGV